MSRLPWCGAWVRVLTAIALLLGFALAGCGKKEGTQSAVPSPASRRPAPEFVLQNLDGSEVRLSDLRGQVVMVNFWATWCPPCRAEIPDFVELQRELGGQGFQIVGISLDQQGASVVAPFAAQNRINYTMLTGGQAVANLYGGIRAIPTTFLVDKQGRIAAQREGTAAPEYWRTLAVALLKERA